MNIARLLAAKEAQRKKMDFLSFTASELEEMRADELEHVIDYFHGYALMRLPDFEVAFFEWLKKKDLAVWQDLWGDEENTYLVSIDLLREFTGERRQFPICDLIDQPNYWFSPRHIKPKGQEALEEIVLKIENNESLAPDELFLVELTRGPLDVWHFCYEHRLALAEMKALIADMVYRGWLVHLEKRDDLVKYIDI